MTWNPTEAWRGMAVPAFSIEDFIDRWYKPARVGDLRATLVASRVEDVAKDGCCIISRHDCVAGRVVSFYPDLSPALAAAGDKVDSNRP